MGREAKQSGSVAINSVRQGVHFLHRTGTIVCAGKYMTVDICKKHNLILSG